MPGEDYLALQERMGRVKDLHSAMGLLSWDQEVYMPPKAAPARGQQLATLAAIAHRMFTDKEVGELLARLGAETTLGPDESKLVEETRYDYDRATRLPEAFVQKFTEERSKAYEAWVRAKDENDFEVFRPNLESIVDLSKQKADLMGYEGSPYNALLEDYERGMTAEGLRPIFSELAERLGRLVERIVASDRGPDTRWLDTDWDRDAQWDFTQRILRDMGYDFEAGRQDESVHPFTTNFDLYDVRLTTKINTKDPFDAIMASIHEGGHGLYEQGFLPSDRHTILAEPITLGIHESQSRLWETLIGQSRAFWAHYGDILREAFPEQLKNVSNDDIHRVVNRVRPTLRRLDADECTYNLHIILRFEIEVALIEGDLKVTEIPELWKEKMKQYLGLDVPDDARGCLQDIHWSHGSIGYFPTYTLGNLYAAQLSEKIVQDIPALWEQVGAGKFSDLLAWLRKNVHQIGRRKKPAELVRDLTGKEPSSEAYLSYLEKKYEELYAL